MNFIVKKKFNHISALMVSFPPRFSVKARLHAETTWRDYMPRLHAETTWRDYMARLHAETTWRDYMARLHGEITISN